MNIAMPNAAPQPNINKPSAINITSLNPAFNDKPYKHYYKYDYW